MITQENLVEEIRNLYLEAIEIDEIIKDWTEQLNERIKNNADDDDIFSAEVVIKGNQIKLAELDKKIKEKKIKLTELTNVDFTGDD